MHSWLAHPLTKGLDVDDPRTTARRRRIILEKPFLRRIYEEWYELIRAALPPGPGAVLEIGSGGGFLKNVLPELIASDVLHVSGVDVILDGTALPFRNGSLRAIVMTNALHHISAPRRFFGEALRCTREGGRVICVEPWCSPWAHLMTRTFHQERFDPDADRWELDGSGPLSNANGAMPWIVFERDRALFEQAFPLWTVEIRRTPMPFRYILSGGVSSRVAAPEWTFGLVKVVETAITTRTERLDMFATVVLTHRPAQAAD